MFDSPDSPEALLDSLERFLHLWHGPPRAWYGIAGEKLAGARLPEPLRRLYAFAGEWPGDNFWRSAFAYQDRLLPFELLALHAGKLEFLHENQGVWVCGTETEGRDPPVWVRTDGPWDPLGTSVAPLLVTACLQETLFGSKHKAHGERVSDRLRASGRHVSPLWLGGPYVGPDGERPLVHRSFHVADGRVLVMNDRWCGTDSDEIRTELSDLFGPAARPLLEPGQSPRDFPAMPLSLRKNLLLQAARDHDEQAKHHAGKAHVYRRLADDL